MPIYAWVYVQHRILKFKCHAVTLCMLLATMKIWCGTNLHDVELHSYSCCLAMQACDPESIRALVGTP